VSERPPYQPADPHTLSRFDGDLGNFRRLVLDMGQLVLEQARLASEALSQCDIAKAQNVAGRRRAIRDLDMDALNANARLFAVHQPVARDLRFVLTLSRAIYDLERISGEAVRLADITEGLYERNLSRHECTIFEDVGRMAEPALSLLDRALEALAQEDLRGAVDTALDSESLERVFTGAIRRMATYVMEDPRNIRWVIDATLGLRAMERIGDHACSIARNIIYSVTGKDVRHASVANLEDNGGAEPGPT
jgi:phosphate transport system protein